MHKFTVSKRLTHKYVDSCRHLDAHVTLGTVKLTPMRMVREPADFDDGGEYVRFATLPVRLRGRDLTEAREALAENLSKWGCTHEYDCCGCELIRTTAHPTRDPRRVLLRTRISYNF